MTGISERKCNAVQFSSMRHEVEWNVERSSPAVVDADVVQRRKDIGHVSPEYLCACTDRVTAFRNEGCASTKEHAMIGRPAKVMQQSTRVENHPVLRNETGCEVW